MALHVLTAPEKAESQQRGFAAFVSIWAIMSAEAYFCPVGTAGGNEQGSSAL